MQHPTLADVLPAELQEQLRTFLSDVQMRGDLDDLALQVTEQMADFVAKRIRRVEACGIRSDEQIEAVLALCVGWILGYGPANIPDLEARKKAAARLITTAAYAVGVSSSLGAEQKKRKFVQ